MVNVLQVNEDGSVHCALITAKSRVAPIKVTTIPRLELAAAVVSVTASDTLKEELGLRDIDEYFWTDSKVVLRHDAFTRLYQTGYKGYV